MFGFSSEWWMLFGGYVLLFIVAVVVSKANYRNGVRDGWRAHRDDEDPLWDMQRKIVRESDWHERDLKLTTEWIRGPELEECQDYKQGDVRPEAKCQTDGHYLCAGCIWNVNRLAISDDGHQGFGQATGGVIGRPDAFWTGRFLRWRRPSSRRSARIACGRSRPIFSRT